MLMHLCLLPFLVTALPSLTLNADGSTSSPWTSPGGRMSRTSFPMACLCDMRIPGVAPSGSCLPWLRASPHSNLEAILTSLSFPEHGVFSWWEPGPPLPKYSWSSCQFSSIMLNNSLPKSHPNRRQLLHLLLLLQNWENFLSSTTGRPLSHLAVCAQLTAPPWCLLAPGTHVLSPVSLSCPLLDKFIAGVGWTTFGNNIHLIISPANKILATQLNPCHRNYTQGPLTTGRLPVLALSVLTISLALHISGLLTGSGFSSDSIGDDIHNCFFTYHPLEKWMEIITQAPLLAGLYEALTNYDTPGENPSFWRPHRLSQLPPEAQERCRAYYSKP